MTALLKYDAACRALDEAVTIDEAKEVFSKAEGIRIYAKQAKNKKLENDAKIIRWRAIRRLGEMLEAQPKAKAGRKPNVEIIGGENPPIETLEEQGVDKDLAKVARRYAAMEGTSFDRLVARCQAYNDGTERLPLDILAAEEKAAKKAADAAAFNVRTADGCTIDDLYKLVAEGRKFSAILADPPWKFMARSEAGEGRSAGQHYRTDAIEAIKALPIAQLAADDCVLFMWMVDWCPTWALEIIEAWGFSHKTTAFTWAKQLASGDGWHMGQGYWTRANPEDCWLATRGSPKRLDAGVRQLIVHPIMEHSRKPDETHDSIERLVAGPYLELYARRERRGWATWGNEIASADFANMVAADPETGEIVDDSSAASATPPSQVAAE